MKLNHISEVAKDLDSLCAAHLVQDAYHQAIQLAALKMKFKALLMGLVPAEIFYITQYSSGTCVFGTKDRVCTWSIPFRPIE